MTSGAMVTLMTDFGTRDGYVAAIKGVILSMAPFARVIDAAHEIPAHDVRAGAWVLRQYAPLYPEGSIHLAVVDPGVGSDRRALVLEADGRLYLAPDNGLLWWVAQGARSVKTGVLRPECRRPGGASATFHGRDVFAYAAGLLASGSTWPAIADPAEVPHAPAWGLPVREAGAWRGEVIHVDRFGNLITNLTAEALGDLGSARRVEVRMGELRIAGISRTYSDVAPGRPLAYVGSDGHLEIAIHGGRAADCGGKPGTAVRIARL